MPRDDRPIALAAVPAFRQPATGWTEPTPPQPAAHPDRPATAPTADQPSQRRPQAGLGGVAQAVRDRLRPPGEDIRTDTSSADGDRGKPVKAPAKIDPELVADAAAAVIGIIILGATIAVRWRSRGQRALRPPTGDDIDTAGPALGRLLQRRLAMASWAPDAVDAFTVLGAAGVYVNRGHLTEPITPATPAAVYVDPTQEQS